MCYLKIYNFEIKKLIKLLKVKIKNNITLISIGLFIKIDDAIYMFLLIMN